MKISLLIISFIILPFLIFANNDTLYYNEMFAIHPKFGYSINQHIANFQSFEGAIDCGNFTNGNGSSWFSEISLEKALNEKYQIILNLGYYNRNAIFNTPNSFLSRDLNTNEIINVNTEVNLNTTLSYFEIAPEFKLTLLKDFINGPLRIGIGPKLSFSVFKKFEQTEKIISPSNATFINQFGYKSQNRNLSSGYILSINSNNVGLRGSIENLLKIGDENYFTQSITIDYNFTNTTNDTEWKIFSINLGLGFRFSIKNPSPTKEPEIKYEIIEEEKAEEEIVEVKKIPIFDLKIQNVSDLKIEKGNELLATIPLVNAVFFDKNSYQIPSFYKYSKEDDYDLFFGSPIEMHKYVLVRISEILKNNSNAKVILQSSTSGNDESDGIELSRKRSTEVRKVLNNLGINNNRIEENVLLLAKNPSNPDVEEGRIENRRVELIIKNAFLQEYVDLLNYKRLYGNIEYNIKAENLDNKDIKIKNNINDETINLNESGIYNLKFKKDIKFDDNILKIKLFAENNSNKISDEIDIDLSKVNEINSELNLDNFLAILLFDFNSNELSNENKMLLNQLVEKLPSGSTIEIIGSTDIIGTNEYNLELARQRASNTQKYINSIARDKFKIVLKTNVDKFSDGTPQGRFLNRSIKIRLLK